MLTSITSRGLITRVVLAISTIAFSIVLGCAQSGSDSSSGSSSGGDGLGNGNIASVPGAGSFSGIVSRGLAACATEDPDDNTLATINAQFISFLGVRKTSSALTSRSAASIPVYFHVISKDDGIENGDLPDSFLIEQIEVLNRAYSGTTGGVPTPFRFQLAGINRVRNAEWFQMAPGSNEEFEMKMQLHVGGPDTLNIYTVNTDGKILGFASFPVFYNALPSFDGVVINYTTLPGGSFSRYNIGHVAVHEVGHWLGLLHTFQGECQAIFGDLVSDTPVEGLPEKGQFCPVGRDSCPDREGSDPVHNHMTYTDDACRTEFSQGQLDLMTFNATVFRGLEL